MPPGWVNAVAGKYSVTTLDGQKVLQKAPDNTIFKRVRAFIGPVDWSNYTIEADVRVTTRRRQMADIGITAQRYSLVLYGNSQTAEARAVGAGDPADHGVPFAWKADTWYHLKLRVENTADGKVRRSRQGVADRRGRAGAVDDRQGGSDRQPPGRPRIVRRSRSSGRISTTSR